MSDRGFHLKKENFPLDVPTIRAAVADETWAYSGEIDHLCTKMKKQPDGSMKKIIDEDMRQTLILKLVESLPQFEAEL